MLFNMASKRLRGFYLVDIRIIFAELITSFVNMPCLCIGTAGSVGINFMGLQRIYEVPNRMTEIFAHSCCISDPCEDVG